jgi:methyltransferase (TIGR00027 family)
MTEPDNTAIRVALWRALHVKIDAAPHVLEDEVGLQLAGPDEGWQNRPDMDPERTKMFRASIVGRARFIEDLVDAESQKGVKQYVILGAGLDTFAQRRPDVASKLTVFEIDQPGTQQWKEQRLIELGMGVAPWLKLVPVDFEAGDNWWQRLSDAGFNRRKPAVVTSTGVSMYITKEATAATLKEVAKLALGSTFAMTFLLPIVLVDPEVRIGMEMSAKGAAANGTPFISFYKPDELVSMAQEAGFRHAQHIPSSVLAERYFNNRTDGLRPPNHAEELLLAIT